MLKKIKLLIVEGNTKDENDNFKAAGCIPQSDNFKQHVKKIEPNTKVDIVKPADDLSISKIYLSVFPSVNFSNVIDLLKKNKSEIRKKLSFLLKHQLRIVPDIFFYIDDSLDYIDKIDEALKDKGKNPIK